MSNYSQQDFNQQTGTLLQSIAKKGPVIFYDVMKFIRDFIVQMVRMIAGR